MTGSSERKRDGYLCISRRGFKAPASSGRIGGSEKVDAVHAVTSNGAIDFRLLTGK
jgi:hypothetical protein